METKNLCAQIPLSLHQRVRAEQAKSEQSLSEYITEILTQYYEGGTNMTGTKTLAIQVSESFYQKLKEHLAEKSQRDGRKISQKEFILTAIEEMMYKEAVNWGFE